MYTHDACIYIYTRIELLLDCFVAVITRRYFLSVVWSPCRTDSTRRRSSSPPFPRLCVPRYFTHIPRCNHQNISYRSSCIACLQQRGNRCTKRRVLSIYIEIKYLQCDSLLSSSHFFLFCIAQWRERKLYTIAYRRIFFDIKSSFDKCNECVSLLTISYIYICVYVYMHMQYINRL